MSTRFRLVQCPNCGIDVIQNDLDGHKKACPLETVQCKYYGCTATFHRKDAEKHERVALLNHSKLMLQLPVHLKDILYAARLKDKAGFDRDMAVLSKMIATVRIHLIILLILLTLMSGYGIISRGEKYIHNFFYDAEQIGPRPYDVAPVVIKMPGFREKLRQKKEWVSRSFYAFDGGYLVYLRVHAAGSDADKNRFVSVYIFLAKDHKFHWPQKTMCGKFKVTLLNQLNDQDHYTQELMGTYDCVDMNPIYRQYNFAGTSKFISHNKLFYSNAKFLENDNLYFKVTYEDSPVQDLLFIVIVIVISIVVCCGCICFAR